LQAGVFRTLQVCNALQGFADKSLLRNSLRRALLTVKDCFKRSLLLEGLLNGKGQALAREKNDDKGFGIKNGQSRFFGIVVLGV
jgi:hypothetical protein